MIPQNPRKEIMEFDPSMFDGGPIKREGTAEMREAMIQVRAMFEGLVEAGFTENQAIVLLANMMRGASGGG